MAVVVDLKLIVGMSLDVHVSRVPIALFGETLRAPVRPYAELRFPKPFGRAILFQRLPLRPERAGSDLAGAKGPVCFPTGGPTPIQCRHGLASSRRGWPTRARNK